MYKILNELATCNMIEGNTPEGWIIVDVRDLQDGGKNSVDAVADKIQLVGNLLANGYKVCVRCQAGMSRSNTIACAVMVWINGEIYWNNAWNTVKSACPRAMLNLEFYSTVKQALIRLNSGYNKNGKTIRERLI